MYCPLALTTKIRTGDVMLATSSSDMHITMAWRVTHLYYTWPLGNHLCQEWAFFHLATCKWPATLMGFLYYIWSFWKSAVTGMGFLYYNWLFGKPLFQGWTFYMIIDSLGILCVRDWLSIRHLALWESSVSEILFL